MKVESHPYEFKLVKAGFITVNHAYQRGRQHVVKHIIENFDYRLVNPVKIVCRNGQYYAWDGQQTTTALREMFGDNYPVPCMVYRDVPTSNEEAILFENINDRKARTPVSDKDLWRSKMSRKEDNVTSILEICGKYGYDTCITNKGHSGKTIRALHAIGNVYQFLDAEKFEEEIGILRETWYGNENALKANMLYGLALFIDCYHGKYDRERLVSKLKDKTPEGILAAATASAAVGNIKYAREILNVYNHHARCPLKDELVSKRI